MPVIPTSLPRGRPFGSYWPTGKRAELRAKLQSGIEFFWNESNRVELIYTTAKQMRIKAATRKLTTGGWLVRVRGLK